MKLFNHLRRVAIIGAGPCGTSLLRAFALAQKKGAKIPELVCYEKQKDWGGLWRFSWQIGFDENGEPTHGSMYRHMFTNVPKEYHEFPDYTYDQHFSKPVPSYLSRQDMYSYLLGRLKDCPEIRKSIKFNTVVRQVEFNTKKDQFIVRAFDTVTGKTNTDYFSHVVVAIGHFSVPEMPSFEGMDEFPGRIVHSHEFRDAQEYVGQTVLIIGGSYSAEDIALQLYKFDAKSITISYRTKPIGHKWPENIKEVPLLVRLEGKTAHFRDETKENFDSIILCTGYRHHFPFLSDDLRLITKNRFYPDNLYKGVLLQHQPRIAFLGMQKFYFSFPGLDAETWYVRDFILGRITLPDAETRLKDAAANGKFGKHFSIVSRKASRSCRIIFLIFCPSPTIHH